MNTRVPSGTTTEEIPASIWDVYREGSKFFMQEGKVYETLRRLAGRLNEEGLDYAVIGGMALVAHGYRRFTEDVDIILTPHGLVEFREKLIGRGYLPAFTGAAKSFRDTNSHVKIEVLTAGEYPGGKPGPVVFPDPETSSVDREGMRVIALEKLIELKLISGLGAPHRQLVDLGDVQRLIEEADLPLELAQELDPSVQAEYRRLWELAQHRREGPHEREP